MSVIKNTPIGLNLPIRNGSKSGYFDQSFDSFTQTRMNIINLLRTIPGERRMQPTFGCRLWNIVFDQNTDVLMEKVSTIIQDDIISWIPGVSVKNVTVNFYSPEERREAADIYKLHIVVKFTIDAIKQEDVVDIYLDKGTV